MITTLAPFAGGYKTAKIAFFSIAPKRASDDDDDGTKEKALPEAVEPMQF